jgi:hypothetical protein
MHQRKRSTLKYRVVLGFLPVVLDGSFENDYAYCLKVIKVIIRLTRVRRQKYEIYFELSNVLILALIDYCDISKTMRGRSQHYFRGSHQQSNNSFITIIMDVVDDTTIQEQNKTNLCCYNSNLLNYFCDSFIESDC